MLEICSCNVIVLGRKTFIIYVKAKQDDHDDRVDTIWEIVEGHSITIFKRVKRFLLSSSNFERCLDARFVSSQYQVDKTFTGKFLIRSLGVSLLCRVPSDSQPCPGLLR